MKIASRFAALFVLLASATLPAHTKISATTPADGAEVAAPTEIRLEFSVAVKLTAINLKDPAGKDVSLGTVSSEPAKTFSVSIADSLAPGRHLVTWRSISGDSHVVSGEFGFTVTP